MNFFILFCFFFIIKRLEFQMVKKEEGKEKSISGVFDIIIAVNVNINDKKWKSFSSGSILFLIGFTFFPLQKKQPCI